MKSISSEFFYDQVSCKRFYRYILLREYLHSVNTSGFYSRKFLTDCAKNTGISYNTLRADLKTFERDGLLSLTGKKIRLLRLQRCHIKLLDIYIINQNEIKLSGKPSLLFADLVKCKILKSYLLSQGYMESKKIKEDKNRDKFRKILNKETTAFGASLGINCSISTIGRIFGKSKITGYNYITKMEKSKVIQVKNNNRRICHVKDFSTGVYLYFINRTFYNKSDFSIYERLPNSYVFNY